MEKKIVSKEKFIFNILVSFLIWDLVTWFLGNLILGMLNKYGDNIFVSISTYIVWILKSLIIICLTYIKNKNKRVAKYELNKVKIINLVIIFILTIGLSISDITESIMASPLLPIIATIIHMFLIAIVNDIMFRRCISNEEK